MARPMIDFERLFQDLPTPCMILGRDLRFVAMNDGYLAVTGRRRQDLLGRYVFDAFPESGERLMRFKAAFERAIAGEPNSLVREPFAIERSAMEGAGRREVVWNCHHVPVYDQNGAICGMMQKAEDVTGEVSATGSRDVIAREFDHRLRNVLATVTSIARASAQSARSTEDFRSRARRSAPVMCAVRR